MTASHNTARWGIVGLLLLSVCINYVDRGTLSGHRRKRFSALGLQDRGPAFPTGAARPSERAGGCGNQGGTGSKHLPGRDAAAGLRLANAVHWRRVEQLIVAASVDLVD